MIVISCMLAQTFMSTMMHSGETLCILYSNRTSVTSRSGAAEAPAGTPRWSSPGEPPWAAAGVHCWDVSAPRLFPCFYGSPAGSLSSVWAAAFEQVCRQGGEGMARQMEEQLPGSGSLAGISSWRASEGAECEELHLHPVLKCLSSPLYSDQIESLDPVLLVSRCSPPLLWSDWSQQSSAASLGSGERFLKRWQNEEPVKLWALGGGLEAGATTQLLPLERPAGRACSGPVRRLWSGSSGDEVEELEAPLSSSWHLRKTC